MGATYWTPWLVKLEVKMTTIKSFVAFGCQKTHTKKCWKAKLFAIKIESFLIELDSSAPYRGQSSSSYGWWVASSHQMGDFSAPWMIKFKFGVLCAPPSSSCWGLVAFNHLVGALVVYGFVCFCFIHHRTPMGVSLKVLWRSDLVWPRNLGSKTMFIYLFLC